MTEPVLAARGCRWISVPGAADRRGNINFLEAGKGGLDFPIGGVFWLREAGAGQWQTGHCSRLGRLVLVALAGGCGVQLDDGSVKEGVVLNDPGRALFIAPFVWQELTDFAAGSVILALSSDLYDVAENLRDYDEFRRQASAGTA